MSEGGRGVQFSGWKQPSLRWTSHHTTPIRRNPPQRRERVEFWAGEGKKGGPPPIEPRPFGSRLGAYTFLGASLLCFPVAPPPPSQKKGQRCWAKIRSCPNSVTAVWAPLGSRCETPAAFGCVLFFSGTSGWLNCVQIDRCGQSGVATKTGRAPSIRFSSHLN